jgi:hypothetical protein
MTLTYVWRAADDLADQMKNSREAQALQRVFDREGREAPQPHEQAVTYFLASMGMLRSRPLLFALHAPQLPRLPMPGPQFEELLRVDGFTEFMQSAARAGSTLLSLIEYVRSRLPGYPNFLAPDLRPQSAQVDMDGLLGVGMPWTAAARRRGLRDSGLPAADLAQVDQARWAKSAEGLLRALCSSEQWKNFLVAADALTPDDSDQLEKACHQFDEATEVDRIHEQAGPLLMRQLALRKAALQAAHESTTGAARDYLEAFKALNRLINQVATLISEQTAYAAPIRVPVSADVSWQQTGTGIEVRAVFDEGASPSITPGRMFLFAGEPPLRGAWIGQGTTMNFNPETGMLVTLTAELLPDSEVLLT